MDATEREKSKPQRSKTMADKQIEELTDAYLHYLENEFGDIDSCDPTHSQPENPILGIIYTPISCCDIAPNICPNDEEIVVDIEYRTENETLYITAYGNQMEVTSYIGCPIHQMIDNFRSWESEDFIYQFTGRDFYADFIMRDSIY